ncbi:MAG: lasso RiPP family leader peptide-containing protein [Actinomycetota bacterium]|jgi:hypothetical protein|nr:lasso RiPP family leader peptide-containing protein [Actinomycetota bacterium]
MTEETTKTPQAERPEPKKEYTTPELVRYGSIEELTQGAKTAVPGDATSVAP